MNAPRALLFLACLLPVAAFFAAGRLAPPLLNSDSATGFLVWDSMAAGAGWNRLLTPDPTDLARETTRFVGWWSPGQYVLPGLLHLAGLGWLDAARVITLLAALVACGGTWRLARVLGVGPTAAAAATLLAATAGGALHGFGMYWGGDLLLGAAAPFLYLAAVRLGDPTRAAVAGGAWFLAACVACLGAKHGGVLAVAGAVVFVGLESFHARGAGRFPDRRAGLALGAAVLAGLLARGLWMGGDASPGAPGQTGYPAAASLGFALNGPWFSLTGAGSFVSWLLQRGGLEYPRGWFALGPWLLGPGAAATALVAWLGLRRAAPRPWRLAACVWLATSGLLALLYLRGAAVSLEDRHFRPAVAPLGVALAAAAGTARRWSSPARLVPLGIGALAVGLGLAAHVRRVGLLAVLPRGPVSGFTQPGLPAGDARQLASAIPPTATVVLLHPSHFLEFPRRRVLVTDAYFREATDLAGWRFRGAVPLLCLPVPRFYDADGRGALLRAAFADLPASSWEALPVGAWTLWSARAPGTGSTRP